MTREEAYEAFKAGAEGKVTTGRDFDDWWRGQESQKAADFCFVTLVATVIIESQLRTPEMSDTAESVADRVAKSSIVSSQRLDYDMVILANIKARTRHDLCIRSS